MTVQTRIEVATDGHRDMKDITEKIARAVRASGVATGIAHAFVVGSTAAIGAIEFEPGLAADLPELLDRVVPPSRSWGHERAWHDGNGHSHLQASWLGPAVSVPVAGGEPLLGEWQQVFLLECDVRPRRRTVVVTVTGD